MLALVVLMATAILQTTVGPAVAVLGVIPDGVLILVVCRALVYGSEDGMLWGLLGGLSLDLLSGSPAGAHALALILIGFVTGLAKSSPLRMGLMVPLLTMAGATMAYNIIIALILRAAGLLPLPWPDLARIVAPAVITNGVLMPFVYLAVSYVAELRGGLRPEF